MTTEPIDQATADRFGLNALSVPELLQVFASVLTELRARGIVRSSNNPVADYSEWLVAKALGLTLANNSVAGYDAVGPDGARYQVKGRRIVTVSGSRQLSVIRGFGPDGGGVPFDFLVGVLFHVDFTVFRAAQVPVDVVKQHATWTPHVNGWRFMLRDAMWMVPGVVDVTDQVRAATV